MQIYFGQHCSYVNYQLSIVHYQLPVGQIVFSSLPKKGCSNFRMSFASFSVFGIRTGTGQ